MAEALQIGITLSERAAGILKDRILTATPGYEPGARLYPQVVSADLGISITPVREAFKILAGDGLLELLPRRGARVVSLSPTEVDDVVSIRAALEAVGVRLRQSPVTEEEISELRRCVEGSEQALKRRDLDGFRTNDNRFHRLLAGLARSERLLALYDTLAQPFQILQLYFPRHWDVLVESVEEHRQLTRVLAERNPRAAEKAMWNHWRHSIDRVRRIYSAEPPRAD